ncbi:MAG TPA: DUF4290 domain-containing protein [Bacteroidales bacterium]|nr:DUF4290 domain-containing protein [Bacteroidales bacterium]
MEYNSQRSKMSISEYGRNIQKMIEQIMEIEDPEKRNNQAKAIINVMGQLNPHLRDVADFKHKLWDHLFIMSDFKLDVNSPFPIPSPQSLSRKPERLEYASNHIKYKHYGRHIEKIIEKACEFEEGAEKTALVKLIANHLKKSYLTWNRDTVTDEEIGLHLRELSHGKLQLDESIKLTQASEVVTPIRTNKKKKFHPKPIPGKPFQFRSKKNKPI